MAAVVNFDQSATTTPIEDLVDGATVPTAQLLPTDEINVPAVYELAYLGLSARGIAAKIGITHQSLLAHFPKTIERARAAHATDHLMWIAEVAAGQVEKPSRARMDAAIYLLEKRLDILPKEQPNIVIQQTFSNLPPQLQAISVEDANDL